MALKYIQLFSDSPHPYIREKVSDIEDLAGRLMSNLSPEPIDENGNSSGKIVLARELYPSELLKLAAESVAGIVLAEGGVTSHVAIIARSLKIPTVVVQCPELLQVAPDTRVLVDGEVGNVYVNPSADIISRFDNQHQTRQQVAKSREKISAEAAETKDGIHVDLMANINLLGELPLAVKMGAAGIGLYRTEFPFLIRPSFPSETEQYIVYRQVAESMENHPVIFRTLDIGGGKTLAYTNSPVEANPELGLRSIRFTLVYRDVFEQQIRAILRAADGCNSLGIMFPLISSLDDFFRAREVVYRCLDRLQDEGLSHHQKPAIGMMVELPAVVETIVEFADVADFFSIGSNDFVQYLLGVDRANKQVAEYYRPEHPAVLRALEKVVRSVTAKGKPIGICGEMGHDPTLVPFLLGIGLRRLSIDPQFMPDVYGQIAGLSLEECQKYANTLLAAGTIEGVRRMLQAYSPSKKGSSS